MNIAIASDHAGFELKSKVIEILSNQYTFNDFGTHSLDSVDYPDYAVKAAQSVAQGLNQFGILICGSGTGVNISANKVKSIRAANCWTEEIAQLARNHNNCNILCLGARFLNLDKAISIINTFISSEFENGRHQNRIDKIHNLTSC